MCVHTVEKYEYTLYVCAFCREIRAYIMCTSTVEKYEYTLYVYVYCKEIRMYIICVRIL